VSLRDITTLALPKLALYVAQRHQAAKVLNSVPQDTNFLEGPIKLVKPTFRRCFFAYNIDIASFSGWYPSLVVYAKKTFKTKPLGYFNTVILLENCLSYQPQNKHHAKIFFGTVITLCANPARTNQRT